VPLCLKLSALAGSSKLLVFLKIILVFLVCHVKQTAQQ